MMRLRQVAWAAADLPAAEAAVELELGLVRCFRDPGVGVFGLHNALFPVGDQFLEIVSPLHDRPDTAAGRHLARREGDAGYMVILQTDDLGPVRTAADRHDVRIVFEADGGSADDGTDIHGIHFHPKDVGGAILSIDRSTTPEEWAWAGPDWRSKVATDVVDALTGVVIEVDDATASAEVWGALCGRRPDGLRIELDDAVIEFREADTGPARGVIGLGLRTADGTERTTMLLGTELTLGPATTPVT